MTPVTADETAAKRAAAAAAAGPYPAANPFWMACRRSYWHEQTVWPVTGSVTNGRPVSQQGDDVEAAAAAGTVDGPADEPSAALSPPDPGLVAPEEAAKAVEDDDDDDEEDAGPPPPLDGLPISNWNFF